MLIRKKLNNKNEYGNLILKHMTDGTYREASWDEEDNIGEIWFEEKKKNENEDSGVL